MRKLQKKFFGIFFFIVLCSGCATVHHDTVPGIIVDKRESVPAANTFYSLPDQGRERPFDRRTITHQVAPGETLWRLAKIYDVSPQAIIAENNLKNDQDLHIGQTLRISQAASPRDVVQLYPSSKWEYIVIHHSATDEGSSLDFNKAHLQKGWDQGVGYHFVIDNGTKTKRDGQIEATPRWIKQLDGAHCKASEMNRRAIGICLVGNFNISEPTIRQMQSLVDLVSALRQYYRIPFKNIIGHGHVEGAATDCPGKQFPWKEFLHRLIK